MDTPRHRPYLALALLLCLAAATAPAVLAQGGDDVDRETERRINRVMVHDDEWATTVPCSDMEDEHPDAVRRTQRGFLGVELTSLSHDLLRHFGVTADDGVMISKVVAGGPAEKSGLKVGDIVTRFDGRVIENNWDLGRAVRNLGGRSADAEVWRDGKLQHVSVQVGQREMCTLDFGKLVGDIDIDTGNLEKFAEQMAEMATKLGAQGAEMGLRIADEVTRSLGEVDWERQFDSLEKLSELDEERMEALQKRLEELEKRMEKEYERFGERYERELEQAMREKERALEARQRELEQRQRELLERTQERHERSIEEQQRRVEEQQRRADELRRKAEERARKLAEEAEEAEQDEDGDGDGGGEKLVI